MQIDQDGAVQERHTRQRQSLIDPYQPLRERTMYLAKERKDSCAPGGEVSLFSVDRGVQASGEVLALQLELGGGVPHGLLVAQLCGDQVSPRCVVLCVP